MSHDDAAAADAASATGAVAPTAAASAAPSASVDLVAESFADEVAGLDMYDDEWLESLPVPRRILRAECVLSHRTSRLLLVLETLADSNNHQAILRTADSFGVQNVWVVESGKKLKYEEMNAEQARQADTTAAAVESATASADGESGVREQDAAGTVSMGAGRWLTLRYFKSTSACIAALRDEGWEIWVSALTPNSARFEAGSAPPIPDRLAIVLGRELDGVSAEMMRAASQSVFLPMWGYSESFNVSVAAALLCQRFFDLCPAARGSMSDEERHAVRRVWYDNLSLATPGARDDYLHHWLPRWERNVAAMRAAVSEQGEAAVLRPLEEARLPKIPPRQRRKMEKEGQRTVFVDKEKAAEQRRRAEEHGPNAVAALGSADSASASSSSAPSQP